MDIRGTIQELRDELHRINVTINSLESLAAFSTKKRSARGRKGMGEEERKQVSERMTKYWESRRQARSA